MAQSHTLPPVDIDNALFLGPYALPFMLGYGWFNLAAGMTRGWTNMIVPTTPAVRVETADLPVPEPLERGESEIFA